MPENELESEQEEGQARSLWSGAITFGLLSLAVDLFPGTRTEAVPLRMVDAEGRPLTRRYYCPEHDRLLARDEIVRGCETQPGVFVVVTEEELDALAPEKSRAIDLRRFVRANEIDPMFFERSYFLTPSGPEAERAYRLLVETMERSERVGIATFVMRGKEYLVALLAEDGVLRVETLRFPDELRRPSELGLQGGARAAAERVDRYRRAIAQLAADELDRGELRDARAVRLRELIERKLERGIDVERAPEPERLEGEAEVIDLMDVLKARLRPLAAAQDRPSSAETSARRGAADAGADELSGKSRSELYERAKALGVPGRSRMGREELLRALRGRSG